MPFEVHVVPVDFKGAMQIMWVEFDSEFLQLAQQFSFLVIFMFHCILQTAPIMNVFHVLSHSRLKTAFSFFPYVPDWLTR